ncbi:hypothetical protein ES332_D13G146700v1, partial [Gossypium tomentosum]
MDHPPDPQPNPTDCPFISKIIFLSPFLPVTSNNFSNFTINSPPSITTSNPFSSSMEDQSSLKFNDLS